MWRSTIEPRYSMRCCFSACAHLAWCIAAQLLYRGLVPVGGAVFCLLHRRFLRLFVLVWLVCVVGVGCVCASCLVLCAPSCVRWSRVHLLSRFVFCFSACCCGGVFKHVSSCTTAAWRPVDVLSYQVVSTSAWRYRGWLPSLYCLVDEPPDRSENHHVCCPP